jgi:N-acetyl-1-D-myo-inositol-2-amino-2-deoxy-alpha-D-glucopyranoside deacetylase
VVQYFGATGGSQTFVFVHAHPDDETLWTGGLIATAAAAEARVVVVTCTRGERGEVLALRGTASADEGWREGKPVALATYRAGELRQALDALGPGIEHHFLDELPGGDFDRYEDSGMVWVAPGIAGPDPSVTRGFANTPRNEAASRLAKLLYQLRDDSPGSEMVIVTYESGGGYGHPDHVRAHQVAVRAAELAQNLANSIPPSGDESRMLVWERVVPYQQFVAANEVLAAYKKARKLAKKQKLQPPLTQITPDAMPPMVLPPGVAPDIVIPVEPVLGNVIAALLQYATQIQAVTEFPKLANIGVLGCFALSNGVLAPIRPTEEYRVH